MDWIHPWFLIAIVPALAMLAWFSHRSLHPMPAGRRRMLLLVRAAAVIVAIVAFAGPAFQQTSRRESVVFVLDHSHSQGKAGMARAHARTNRLIDSLPGDHTVGVVSAGEKAVVRRMPTTDRAPLEPNPQLAEAEGAHTNLAGAVRLAAGLFEPGAARRIVLVTDGLQTRGDVRAAAREASLSDIVIDTVPVAGAVRPDVRVARLRPSRDRLHEGSDLALHAEVHSSLDGAGKIRLFENGIEVDSRPIELEVGQRRTVTFKRTPAQRNLYAYRVVVEGFEEDRVHANNQAMALVDVHGRPVLLYIEGEDGQSKWLAEAMATEGIRLVTRPPEALPDRLQEMAGYDGVILSDLPADRLDDKTMLLLRDYVEQLGGGFLMIGGKNSFGVGGYYRTPIEEILPVKMKAPDKEERYSTALMLVLDRSGSMSGHKIEICKSAAAATVDLLTPKDFVGVVAFDSTAHWVVPMTRASDPGRIERQIATLNSGGGTNLHPGMVAGRQALASVKARAKHMIVLTDGRTQGGGYSGLAAQLREEGVTISTVGVGGGADLPLLQSIAASGGGEFYATQNVNNIPQIFTRDAMTHLGRLIREQPFAPEQVERHPMLRGWPAEKAPPLLGYVKTHRKATTRVPLVTDMGDPLLATWRYGLGKVVAFTSDCKSRWGAMWVTSWQDGYNQFWAQVLRETAREPQGQFMDIRLERGEDDCGIIVDVMEDAATYANEADATATVYFNQAQAMGGRFAPVRELKLQQTGPGRYEAEFGAEEAGVYLVRARAGTRLVSAGLVRNPSGETATGQVDRSLLERVARMTGGQVVKDEQAALPEYERAGFAHHVELRPALLMVLVVLFLVDVAVRRWQSIQALLRRG